MPFKLGKLPAVDKPTDLLLSNYLLPEAATISPPTYIGFIHVFGGQWAMLGNDQWGDCVFAGADHETQLLNWIGYGANRLVRTPQVQFSTNDALSDYSAVTGFNPNDPSSDKGTYTQDALDYRRKTGLLDATGARHKIAAYAKLTPGDPVLARQGLFAGEVLGIGINFPSTAMDQFNSGQPWTYVRGASIEGGHYIPVIAAEPGWLYVVTWGQTIKMSDEFYHHYCDESYMILSAEGLFRRRQTTYSGLNWAQLEADAGALGSLVGG
jgi:hypothetical protein